jgi:SSS family solute:Na+ symporter
MAPVFIFLLPGMIAVALFKQKVSRASRTSVPIPSPRSRRWSPTSCPSGLRGLVLAGMLSALMSALASLFNSTATLFTVDFYKRLRPQSSERHLVRVGRIATAAVVVVGMIWIPIMQSMSKQLYSYLQLVQSLLAPGIAAGLHGRHLLAQRDAQVRASSASPRDSHSACSAWCCRPCIRAPGSNGRR